MKTTQALSQRRTTRARRTALALLAALAITLGAVAAPLLAGTAHAGSTSGATGDIKR